MALRKKKSSKKSKIEEGPAAEEAKEEAPTEAQAEPEKPAEEQEPVPAPEAKQEAPPPEPEKLVRYKVTAPWKGSVSGKAVKMAPGKIITNKVYGGDAGVEALVKAGLKLEKVK